MGLNNKRNTNLIMIFSQYQLVSDGDESRLELLLGFLVARFLYLTEGE